MFYRIYENEAVCANCKHYRCHYVYDVILGFQMCNCGHCTLGRLKGRKPGDTCNSFLEKGEIP